MRDLPTLPNPSDWVACLGTCKKLDLEWIAGKQTICLEVTTRHTSDLVQNEWKQPLTAWPSWVCLGRSHHHSWTSKAWTVQCAKEWRNILAVHPWRAARASSSAFSPLGHQKLIINVLCPRGWLGNVMKEDAKQGYWVLVFSEWHLSADWVTGVLSSEGLKSPTLGICCIWGKRESQSVSSMWREHRHHKAPMITGKPSWPENEVTVLCGSCSRQSVCLHR